jgi:predicted NUDIX family phosphoesterase
MVDEERDVWFSLKEAGYQFMGFIDPLDDDAPRSHHFVSVSDLYTTYKAYRRKRREDQEDDLNVQQFGVAFNAVTENLLRKVRRRVTVEGKRKLVWGYAGVLGPKTHTTRIRVGRPRVR